MKKHMTDFDVEASRATKPYFYSAPYPEDGEYVPYDYQFAGVEYHLKRNNALFGDAPGLGKTAECILLGNAIEAKNTLVVCPASLRLNWEREIWRWSTQTNVNTYPILKSSDGVSLKADYTITSYDMLRNSAILEAIMDQMWDHLILDEAHALKDPKGNKRTKVLCAPDMLPSVVGRITMASGTILPNQPIECYNMIRLLNWDAIDQISLTDFRNYYYGLGGGMIRSPVLVDRDEDNNPIEPRMISKLHWSDKVRNVPRNLDDLQYRLRKHVMVRRLKEQVLHELPPKRWHVFPLAITPAMRKALKHPGWKRAEKMYEMDLGAFDRNVPVDGAISTARRLLGEAKAPAVVDYINELMSEGITKLVVAAWHHSVLDYMREKLAHHGLVYMDGNTTTVKKQYAVDQFQGNADIGIILGQMGPLGMGWNFSVAQDVLNAEPDWVEGRNEQLLDRPHRPGQQGDYVLGHMPVVPGTMDERIVSNAIRKGIDIYAALDKQ
ncbi:hypothetical protein LCGC14_0610310 [marine sediment metagenome]|uniref:Helicase ATP-binding domain-containing protein n=1 Tax=marine sediment metagenome TaxID=412755 RepID=A0A0F9RS14_9ZZZZ